MKIRLLDNNTIDQIAAGEVVERPVSIVKELVENAIDAGATIITVEIKDCGIRMIRVTDNGCGIEADEIRNAFLSHATSKISSGEDLHHLSTLGFRGEALASIAAVSRVEVTTRTADDLEGIHYCIEGGSEISCEPVGAPVGTTFIVRDIFYNTLPRLKFLKSAQTEGNNIADMMEHIALSMPGISFQFIANGNIRFSTSGHGDLKEVIYRIFGKDTAAGIRQICYSSEELSMSINGYLGIPAINRSNRASEIFFINHRYVRSPLISRAVEEGYQEYLMQHKFPFCVLDLSFDPAVVDVNVHPTKQEVRISNEREVSDAIVSAVADTLSAREMLDDAAASYNTVKQTPVSISSDTDSDKRLPESFEQQRIHSQVQGAYSDEYDDRTDISFTVTFDDAQGMSDNGESAEYTSSHIYSGPGDTSSYDSVSHVSDMISPDAAAPSATITEEEYKEITGAYEQSSFADDERVLSEKARREYRIIGQVFKTYWLIEYRDQMMIMDQHAAHEKVNFERFMKRLREKEEIPSQMIAPPVITGLNNREMQTMRDNLEYLTQMGFAIDEFGDHEIAIRAVPMDLYGERPQDLVGEIISDLMDMKKGSTPDSIRTRIATMACKASVKGNNLMHPEEIEKLLDEVLTLDNPYNCPHGRPTLITMSKYELDKRFHRIV